MNKIDDKKNFFSGGIICSLFGHKTVTTRNVSNHFKEYKCSICGLELTNDLYGNKVFLTPELKDINESLMQLNHNKRNCYI